MYLELSGARTKKSPPPQVAGEEGQVAARNIEHNTGHRRRRCPTINYECTHRLMEESQAERAQLVVRFAKVAAEIEVVEAARK